jgi:hypothetical protein
LPRDFAFGYKAPEDKLSAGDLIHNRATGLRGQDAKRAAIAAAQHQLQRANFQNFSFVDGLLYCK